ncbi:MAG: ribosome small subunit-dependent GTPase A [Flavobacteriales bacterium]|nr:ribosome small subunit-dependent GTPase A [Flavobacteriales bacterium]
MKGLVLKTTGKYYDVEGEDGKRYSCQVRGKLRLKGSSTTNPVAAGDHVSFEEQRGEFLITDIFPRKNYIIRKSVNLSREASIIAANIDRAFLLVTHASPDTPAGFIDRFLVTAEAYSIPAVLLFHKFDQYNTREKEEVESRISDYEKVGYTCLRTSIISGLGIDTLRELMSGKVSLFSGQSGAGKSSLINTLLPGLELRTSEISSWSDKGQHTTTFAEMFTIPGGGYLVDTPGIKGFGLVDIPKEELHHHFIEFFRLLPECKFSNCMHINEPGCAVRRAVESGQIPASRYKSYLSMFNDEEETYRGGN